MFFFSFTYHILSPTPIELLIILQVGFLSRFTYLHKIQNLLRPWNNSPYNILYHHHHHHHHQQQQQPIKYFRYFPICSIKELVVGSAAKHGQTSASCRFFLSRSTRYVGIKLIAIPKKIDKAYKNSDKSFVLTCYGEYNIYVVHWNRNLKFRDFQKKHNSLRVKGRNLEFLWE